jgi:multidrug resistance protein
LTLRSARSTAVALVTFATFTDIVAYSVAVPVLPDFTQRLGASPTTIGLLFASFGVTLLLVSMPMGAISDRVGRKGPMLSGLVGLAFATVLFAFSSTLPALFAARLAQGAADAVTWVVGFALIADLYGPEERGRITGIVMAGTGFAFMVGPSLGGWLYELGGVRLPFLITAGMALVGAAGFLWLDLPDAHTAREPVPIAVVVREPAIAACAVAVVITAATTSMLEPVMAMHLRTLGVGPARTGLLFGIGALTTTLLHPIFGRLADRVGARRLTLRGLLIASVVLPVLGRTQTFPQAMAIAVVQIAALALVITPSLAYMGEATSEAGIQSFGIAYGLYNVAWGVGLLGGPAIAGFMYEHIGFFGLALVWSPIVIAITLLLMRTGARPSTARV